MRPDNSDSPNNYPSKVPSNSVDDSNTATHTPENYLNAKLAHFKLPPPDKQSEESSPNEVPTANPDEHKDAEHHKAEHTPPSPKHASHTEDSLTDLDEPKHTKHHKTEPINLSEESLLVGTETPDPNTDNFLPEKGNTRNFSPGS